MSKDRNNPDNFKDEYKEVFFSANEIEKAKSNNVAEASTEGQQSLPVFAESQKGNNKNKRSDNLTLEEVMEACIELQAQGLEASVRNIKDKLKKGSFTTISNYKLEYIKKTHNEFLDNVKATKDINITSQFLLDKACMYISKDINVRIKDLINKNNMHLSYVTQVYEEHIQELILTIEQKDEDIAQLQEQKKSFEDKVASLSKELLDKDEAIKGFESKLATLENEIQKLSDVQLVLKQMKDKSIKK